MLSRPLLPGVEAPWLEARRRELSRLLLRGLEALAAARLALGEHQHAVAAAEDAAALDAFHESAYRLAMRAHAGAGDGAAALRVYERCRRILADELGADPSPETQALHVAILRSGAQLRPDEPAPQPAGMSQHVCPCRGLQPFEEADAEHSFGRSADVSRLLDRLRAGRFLAVVGPTGSGKSSLVRAGLVPALGRGGLPGSDTWPAVVLRPSAEPLKALASELTQLDASLGEAAAVEQLLTGELTLHAAVEGALAGRAGRVLVVVDQLEEVFTLCDDEAQRRAFLTALGTGGPHTTNQPPALGAVAGPQGPSARRDAATEVRRRGRRRR